MELPNKFLLGLKSLPSPINRQQTFMEIAGYPHFENVCSNILAFYFNPANEHGFRTLLLDSLNTLIEPKLEIIDSSNIEVRREEPTSEAKRIDLLIYSDDFVIGIENKVYATANYSPFCDYARHLDSLGKNSEKVRKVLLSLRPERRSPELHGFQHISYKSFLKAIEENFQSYSKDADKTHLIFLKDFIKTMENLQSSTISPDWLKYFKENDNKDIEKLLVGIDVLSKDITRKLDYLEEIITADENVSQHFIKQKNWNSQIFLSQTLIYTIKPDRSPDHSPFSFGISLAPTGWSIDFWNQDKRNKDFIKDRETKSWFESRGIKVKDRVPAEGTPWLLEYQGEDFKLPYETDPEDIKNFVSQMWNRLNINCSTEPAILNLG